MRSRERKVWRKEKRLRRSLNPVFDALDEGQAIIYDMDGDAAVA